MSYIANIFGVTKTGISTMFKREGLKARGPNANRKYKVNENYFDVIDTPNKAYVLGFLYADGYNNPITKSMVLDLKEEDKEILEKISIDMENENPLYHSVYKSNFDGIERNQWKLIVNSKHIYEQLIKLGCPPNKTFILQFPSFIPENLMPHFIRGYFDGDGCFSYSFKTNRVYIYIISSTDFCLGLQSFLLEKLQLNFHLNKAPNNNKNNSSIRASNKEDVKKFLEYMYKNSELKLERKFKKVLEFYGSLDI